MKRTALSSMILLLATLGGLGPASTDEGVPKGDPAAGRKIAETRCAGCHGPKGISEDPEIPHLAGQHEAYLTMALRTYLDGERADPHMDEAIAGLDAGDVADIAAYFASQPPFTTAAPGSEAAEPFVEPDPFADARELTAACAGCHGEDGNSDLPGTPRLAGQNYEYLIAALKAYRDGGRDDEMMAPFVEGMSDEDFETIAFYYASAEPRRADTELVGDPFAGQAPSAECAGCHGSDGNTKDPAMPNLAGMDSEYLATAIRAYKAGNREDAAMQDAVAALREDQIQNLAAFYASETPQGPQIWKPRTTAEWVERCDRCHGPDGRSQDPRFPILAGQHEAYLAKALKLYHGSERPSTLMQAMSFTMNRTDIKKLAAYYARQGGE